MANENYKLIVFCYLLYILLFIIKSYIPLFTIEN